MTVGAYNCMRAVVERSACSVSTKGVLMHISRLYLPARINIRSLNLTDFSQNVSMLFLIGKDHEISNNTYLFIIETNTRETFIYLIRDSRFYARHLMY